MYMACLTTGVQVIRDGRDPHDMAQTLPVSEIVHVRPIDSVELFHDGVFELLVSPLPLQIGPAPTGLVAKTIKFPWRGHCGIILESRSVVGKKLFKGRWWLGS
jgi:hypothetical protein